MVPLITSRGRRASRSPRNEASLMYSLSLMSEEGVDIPGSEPLYSIRSLTKKFGTRIALSSVTLTFYKNEMSVVYGKNGSGKTTLLQVMAGMLSKTSGQLTFHSNIYSPNYSFYQLLGYCPQHNPLPLNFTLSQLCSLFLGLTGQNQSSRQRIS